MTNIDEFKTKLKNGESISMVTCYDYTSARIIDASNIDSILIGDSAAMVMHGHSTTINATVEMMVTHIAAVRRGAPEIFLVADMPFLAHRRDLNFAMDAVTTLMQAGANAIKIEGACDHLKIIKHIVDSGVPVMGHLGLTPQSVYQLGGFKVQGRNDESEKMITEDAANLQGAGCFSLVLELVPAPLAKKITDRLEIPTIGIGAGPDTSGQILVFQDLLGMNEGFRPKFLRTYLDGFDLIKEALNNYVTDVRIGSFPAAEESFQK